MRAPWLPLSVVLSCSLSLATAQEPPTEKPAEKPDGKDSIPYLEKAAAAGEVVAHRGLGLVHLTLGDKAKALAHLREWSAAHPDDVPTKEMIAAIENGAPIERKSGPVQGDGK